MALSFNQSVRAEIARRADQLRNWTQAAFSTYSALPLADAFAVSVRIEIKGRCRKDNGWLAAAESVVSNSPAAWTTAMTAIKDRAVLIGGLNPETLTFETELNLLSGEVDTLIAAGIDDA